MNILSVCTNLPTERNPLLGLFVLRRIETMAELARVRALIPQPWFPVLRPGRIDPPLPNANFKIGRASMFYVPGVAQLNARWMKRCVGKWLDNLGENVLEDAVLDAHFGYPEGVGCFLAARERKLPVFITIRGLEVELFNTRSRGPQLIEALTEATGVIAVSHSLKDAAVKAGVPASQITVIPNGVDSEIYCMGDKDQARAAIDYRKSDKLIVSVGNLKPVKGHDTLIRAVALVAKSVNIQLVCIGGGVESPWGKELQKLINEMGVAGRVHLVGPKPSVEVADWLRAADLFALASHREGCCNAVLEALSTGIPVVTTEAGDNPTIVHEPICGRVVPTKNPPLLANAIDDCLEYQFDHHSIADSVSNWTWSSVAEKVTTTFRSKIIR